MDAHAAAESSSASPSEHFKVVGRLPFSVSVAEIVASRYPNNSRPPRWEERREGVDIVRTDAGELIRLWSDGGQSPPQAGWRIVLIGPGDEEAYRWTLHGLPRSGRARTFREDDAKEA